MLQRLVILHGSSNNHPLCEAGRGKVRFQPGNPVAADPVWDNLEILAI